MSKEIEDIIERLDKVISKDLSDAAFAAVSDGSLGAIAIGHVQDKLKSIRLALWKIAGEEPAGAAPTGLSG